MQVTNLATTVVDPTLFEPARQLLQSWSLGKYLRTKPPSTVIRLSASDTCGHALRMLATHCITSAPMFDQDSYVGFVDVSDILRALLGAINVWELSDETREYKLRAAGLQLEHLQLRSLQLAQDGALIEKADMQLTLHDILLYGFLRPSAAGYVQVVHRVGVFDSVESATSDDDMASDAPEGLPGIKGCISPDSITHVMSQSDVVQFLCKHASELEPLANTTLKQLGLVPDSARVVCVPAEMSTVNAFATMMANKVSCVGVISHAHGGGLVASLSSSDLLGVQPEHFGVLAMPVLDFLTAKASAGWGAQQHNQQQGLQQQQSQHRQQQHQHYQQQLQQQLQPLAGSAHKWGLKGAEGSKPLQLISCRSSSTLQQVLELMASHRLHRLHVLDERQHPAGVVAITDLLSMLAGNAQLLAAYGQDLETAEEVQQLSAAQPLNCGMGLDAGRELVESSQANAPAATVQGFLDAAV